MTANVPDSVLRVVTFDINEMGEIIRKVPKLDREEQLENTILQGLYPDIRVARLNIPPGRLEAFQEALVEHSMSNFEADGVRYRLVGASASAKSGKFYAVDERYERVIGARFQHWPQAAVTYFGILAGPCQVRIELPEARVVVVKDHELGTNDCRGWLSHSLFLRLRAQHQAAILAREVARVAGARGPLTPHENDSVVKEAQQNVRDMALPAHRLYQFRLAFDNTQAKGSFKVMADDSRLCQNIFQYSFVREQSGLQLREVNRPGLNSGVLHRICRLGSHSHQLLTKKQLVLELFSGGTIRSLR